MPELRKDYILEKYVIIATERAKRPEQFKLKTEDSEPDDISKCYFCPGNEHMTPPELYRIEKGSNWKLRVFDNKFSAVNKTGNFDIRTDNDFFTYAEAVGNHEVIAETPEHEKQLWDLEKEDIFDLFKVYVLRINEIKKNPAVRYVQVFKNHKKEAGTSIKHSHSQIIGYNIVPTVIRKKEEAVAKYSCCPYCRIMLIERESFRRCFENESVIAFTPYASASPFEINIFPKRHVLSITDLNDKEIYDMADVLNKILKKLRQLNIAFNYYLHYGIDKMHFHIVVMPRTSIMAGFEFGTETIINTLPPEQAAEFYRSD